MSAELNNLDEFKGLEDNRDSRWRTHLQWMFDHQPDLCRQLHQQRKLGPWCDRNYQQALTLVDKLQAEGVERETAWEAAQSEIQAPPPPDPPPSNPLSLQEQQQMRRSLLA